MNILTDRHIKQIRDGVAYNTRTSSLLGTSPLRDRAEYERQQCSRYEQLFRTRGGRYFVVHREIPRWSPEGTQTLDDIEVVSKERAIAWLKECNPDSFELALMTLPFASPPPPTGTAVSVRLDSSLKDGIAFRAKCMNTPANALFTLYLKHGFVNAIEREPPPPDLYKTTDDIPLLNDLGEAAYAGISENGSRFDILRAEIAAAFRAHAHTVPNLIREALTAALGGNLDTIEPEVKMHEELRQTLLADILRWLKLYEPRKLAPPD